MTDMDRRSVLQLTSAAAVAGGLVAGSGGTAQAARRAARRIVLTGRRTGANIPDVLTAGVPYFVRYDLSDAQGAAVGTENAHCLPVAVDLDGSFVLATLVLSLDDGLITAATAYQRPLPAVTESPVNPRPWSHTFAITAARRATPQRPARSRSTTGRGTRTSSPSTWPTPRRRTERHAPARTGPARLVPPVGRGVPGSLTCCLIATCSQLQSILDRDVQSMTARSIRVAVAATLATALSLTAAACSNPDSAGNGSGTGTTSAVVGIAYEPDSLSPLLGYGKDGNSKIFDGLLALDADMKLRPALAAELPAVSADGLTYTYKLRQGVKFSDGKAFSAKDVVFTYRTILDAKTNNPSRTELDAVKDVTAKGEDTVVFTLKYPYAPFAQRTVLPIAPSTSRAGRTSTPEPSPPSPSAPAPTSSPSGPRARSSASPPTPTTGAANPR